MKESKRKPWVGRTYKRGYTGSKRFDHSCRNHGSCDYCKSNRTHKNKRNQQEGLTDEQVDRAINILNN